MSLRNGFGNDSHCVLLTHANETVDTFTLPYFFTESSHRAHTCYLSGSTAKDLAQYKFGALYLGDNNGSWSVTGYSVSESGWGFIECVDNESDWDFEYNDFTIDFWIRVGESIGGSGLYGSNGVYLDKDNYFGFCYDNGSVTAGTGLTFIVRESASNSVKLQGNPTITIKSWNHIAVTRHENTFRLFFNGEIIDSTTTLTYKMPAWGSSSISYLIGAITTKTTSPPLTPVRSMLACYDEFRISKGICRWTSAFTLPNREY
jgi:hypothetical protein